MSSPKRIILFICILIVSVYIPLALYKFENTSHKITDISNETDAVKILSFNIRVKALDFGINTWENRKNKVIGTLNFYDPDLIGFQEDEDSQVNFLRENLPEYQAVYDERDYDKKFSNNAIFFRKTIFKLIDNGMLWLSETPNKPSKSWGVRTTRTMTYAKLEYLQLKKTVIVINVHLDNRSKEHRINSAGIINNFLQKYNPENYDVIITGDFNEGIAQPTQREFIKYGFNDTWTYCYVRSCCSYKDVFMSFHGFLGNTINNKFLKPLVYLANTYQGGELPSHYGYFVDWILYKGDNIIPVYIHLINNHDSTGIYSSDHFPIFSVFRFS